MSNPSEIKKAAKKAGEVNDPPFVATEDRISPEEEGGGLGKPEYTEKVLSEGQRGA